MGGGAHNDPPATIPNPRHAELVAALGKTQSLKAAVDDRLKGVVSAMKAHAWTGGTSDQFFSELTSNQNSIHTGTQGCVDNCRTALSNCPATKPNPAAKQH